jgi:hypothetical protein
MTNLISELQAMREKAEAQPKADYEELVCRVVAGENVNPVEADATLARVNVTPEQFGAEVAKRKRIAELQAIIARFPELDAERIAIGERRAEDMADFQKAVERDRESNLRFQVDNGEVQYQLRKVKEAKVELFRLENPNAPRIPPLPCQLQAAPSPMAGPQLQPSPQPWG